MEMNWKQCVKEYFLFKIHSDEGLTLQTSVFESFTVANLPYRPVVDNLFWCFTFSPTQHTVSFETKSPIFYSD